MQQVAVAVLHVDEVESGFAGHHCGVDEESDEVVEFVIADQVGVTGAHATIEERMAIRDARGGGAEGS